VCVARKDRCGSKCGFECVCAPVSPLLSSVGGEPRDMAQYSGLGRRRLRHDHDESNNNQALAGSDSAVPSPHV
jgi:hypothetical protein